MRRSSEAPQLGQLAFEGIQKGSDNRSLLRIRGQTSKLIGPWHHLRGSRLSVGAALGHRTASTRRVGMRKRLFASHGICPKTLAGFC